MNFEMIKAAAGRLDGHARQTPILSSPFLDEIAGRKLMVKPECLQRTGSFKFRGAWSAISALSPETRARGVIAFSSGNHAQGIALAAREHAIPAVIVMPNDAPALKIANTKGYGAEVVLYDRPGGESREAVGEALARERGLTLIKPFDEPLVIAGQGTVGLEIAEQSQDGDVLVCCGGGGLTAGIALALAETAPKMRVRPVEPVGFDDMARSMISGVIEKNDTGTGNICDAILTPQPGEITFPIIQRLCGPGLVVTEQEACRAMVLAWQHLKVVAEPGGAVALAAALFHADKVEGPTVTAVVSGGNVDPTLFAETLQRYG
ncbi:threonine ammonia-lyase [Actibacterium mucosum KCTC 23349]|uniref:Threonine ammonia-lyase n=1 Tax=Actibacterium mucosum KCTC 23349 TaxID=1454373 RepID=A0A037ZME4_9RHOB|nr:threonine/serine dehydratase [Actibacterium mucosum]KAJ55961.1 threonine ammonia-lyase [Actibacterium mucosum KCTC 23349]